MWTGSKPRFREDLCGFPHSPHGIFRKKCSVTQKMLKLLKSIAIHRVEKRSEAALQFTTFHQAAM
ncbi:MAG: hypothetical protein HC767_15280 [Akkermansiaceae bacterium]|nr:hypothetical protein [Akkermansiaceae bacterium]